MDKNMKFGITKKKSESFQEWYHQVITLSDLIDNYNIRGCIIMRPSAMFIWNQIKGYFDKEIEKLGVDEVYFPMLISKEFLEKEKDHIANFQPEVAWVTKSGHSDIEPLAIRPTSETVMYPYFSKWIRSHRDLPFKVNQWCNILRWEVKSTVPFIRGREFLWQEGHCAYEDADSCSHDVKQIQELYYNVYKELLAVPTIKGRKSEAEKFGGALFTLTVEAFIIESAKAVQAATSHNLGTNFAKMFDVKVDNKYVYQSSWGITTRSIGVAVMTHGDDKGLVLSPRISKTQIVIIPCGKKSKNVDEYIEEIRQSLTKYRVYVDDRENVSCGYKFNYHEIRGVPIRIEVGERDYKQRKLVIVPRHTLNKKSLEYCNLENQIENEINNMHNEMYEAAEKRLEQKIKSVEDMHKFIELLNDGYILLASWCDTIACEESIKVKTEVTDESGAVVTMGAKSLCIPYDMQENIQQNCFQCQQKAKCKAIFGRTY
ncbi:hypothetical protein BDAP_002894 [Binucleata daphniae]